MAAQPPDGVPVRTKECRHGPMSYLAHDLYIGRSLDLYGEFSQREVELLVQLVPETAVVIEAGANIGTATVPLARAAGPQGRLIAYEPQAAMAALLRHNLAQNRLAHVEVRQAALGRAPGTVRMPRLDYGRAANFGGMTMNPPAGVETTEVPLETIDALALPRLDLLKVDVEGMEVDVLSGATETIRRLQPVLYVENHNSRTLVALTETLGYRASWHLPPLFNPQNFFGNRDDVFPNIISINVLCTPPHDTRRIVGTTPVQGPDDTWQDAARRLRGRG